MTTDDKGPYSPPRKGARLRAGCKDFQHDSCTAGLACGCACHACTDTHDGMPCHGDKGHDGDHWNFYAERHWPVEKGS